MEFLLFSLLTNPLGNNQEQFRLFKAPCGIWCKSFNEELCTSPANSHCSSSRIHRYHWVPSLEWSRHQCPNSRWQNTPLWNHLNLWRRPSWVSKRTSGELPSRTWSRSKDQWRDWSSFVNHRSPLHWSCYHGHERVARALLDHGADPRQADDEGVTPLHLACFAPQYELAVLLTNLGADVDALDTVLHSLIISSSLFSSFTSPLRCEIVE